MHFELIHLYKGYAPTLGHIQDTYKVWVSPMELYVEPFCQRGVHQYHETLSYDVCSLVPVQKVVYNVTSIFKLLC